MKSYEDKLLQLANKLADRIPVRLGLKKITVDDPEYWGLKEVLSEDMVDLLLLLEKRKPYTFDELLDISKLDIHTLQLLLDKMSDIGMMEYNFENSERIKQYIVPQFVPGSAEFFMMHKTLATEHPKLAKFFERMTYVPLEGLTQMIPPGGAGIGMHVIPVEKAIQSNNEAISIEKISYWLDKYDDYAIGICSCRKQQAILNEGTGDIPGEYCIGIGDMAKYLVETNKGRRISYEEVLETLERCERHGYVHQVTNIDGEDKIFAICNCAAGVCNALRTSQLFNTPNMSASSYRAHVNKDLCVACGKCVSVCPVGAAKLGHRLCDINYPKSPLPKNHIWSKKYYDYDYKDHAKLHSYDTGTAPCISTCPAHISVQAYIHLARVGKYEEALKLIKQDNPFPAICGSICNHRCEDACSRGSIDQAIAIDDIKNFIALYELEEGHQYIPLCENGEGKFYDKHIGIIGGGPAGLSCAYFLRQRGYHVTVYEKEEQLGGMLRYGIPDFRLDKKIIDCEIDVLKKMGIEFKCGVCIGKDISFKELEDQYDAIYIAVGASKGKIFDIPGSKQKHVISSIEYLKEYNTKGTHHLANGEVIIYGGGNVAIDTARSCIRDHFSKVSIVCVEDSIESMNAHNEEIQEAIDEGIHIYYGYGIDEIKQDTITVKKCISLYQDGKFNPLYGEETMNIHSDVVIFASGQMGDVDFFETNQYGFIDADIKTYQTNNPKVFVGGDIFTGPKFAIDAIACGKQASESIHRYVHPGQSLTLGRDFEEYHILDYDTISKDQYDKQPRLYPAKVNNHRVFTKEEVVQEASRCLGCGVTIVDTNKCIGCGLCTTKCGFNAITLTRDEPHGSDMVKAEDKLKVVVPYMIERGINIIKRKKD